MDVSREHNSIGRDNALKYLWVKVRTSDSSLIHLKGETLANKLCDKKKGVKCANIFMC